MWFDDLSPKERLIAEQAVLNFRVLNQACDAAADGTVLAVAEQLALKQGRELTRKTLETSNGQTSRSSQKKSPAGRTCSCGLKKAHHGAKRRRLVRVVGEVQLVRASRISSMPANTLPTPLEPFSEMVRRRPRGGWTRAATFWCPQAGPASGLTSPQHENSSERNANGRSWTNC